MKSLLLIAVLVVAVGLTPPIPPSAWSPATVRFTYPPQRLRDVTFICYGKDRITEPWVVVRVVPGTNATLVSGVFRNVSFPVVAPANQCFFKVSASNALAEVFAR